MHLEDAHRNGASCAIRPGSAQQSTRTAKWKEAEKKWKKLVVKARAVLGQEEKQRHKTLTKEGRNAHQWFSGHASLVPVQSWKPIDTLREKEKESKKIGGETRMVFEGERCEANKNKNKKKKRKKKKRTRWNTSSKAPIFSELSHHLSRYRQKPPQTDKEKGKKSKHRKSTVNRRLYLFRKSHHKQREGTIFLINKKQLVVRLYFSFFQTYHRTQSLK